VRCFRRVLLVGILVVVSGLAVPLRGSAESIRQVTTHDGRLIEGSFVGGSIAVESISGTRVVDARKIRTLTRSLLEVDGGYRLMGQITVTGGEVQVETAQEMQTISASEIAIISSGEAILHGNQSLSGSGRPTTDHARSQSGPVILGRWKDNSGYTWEFFEDGTYVNGQVGGTYRILSPRRVKIDVTFMFGMGGARVYDIEEQAPDRLALIYQGNRTVLTRVP
jgi:hypothetical protein